MGTLTEAQSRAILSRAIHVDRLLSQVLHMLDASDVLAPTYVMDLSPDQVQAVRVQVHTVRAQLEDTLTQLGIAIPPPHQSVRRAASTTLLFAADALDEWRPKTLAGYGNVSPEAAEQVDRLAESLQEQLAVLQQCLRA